MKAAWAVSPGPRMERAEEIRYRHRQSLDRRVTALTQALRDLACKAHSLVRCGGKSGGCLVCGRLVECCCELGPAIDRADDLTGAEPEPDPRDAGGEALKYGPLHMAERLAASEAALAERDERIAALERLVEAAYREGHREATGAHRPNADDDWSGSQSRAALREVKP